ncbi:hypothetical protein C7M84_002241 [Penaeus vannamei]|uniref:Uncharacterized protein n=1 Tax=Penaeus vannamei TaxID=6689 RepID=A0A3R7QUS7_PENVA|nr:hypothetical protein C7M84_002241 [Penaeus vannamei]
MRAPYLHFLSHDHSITMPHRSTLSIPSFTNEQPTPERYLPNPHTFQRTLQLTHNPCNYQYHDYLGPCPAATSAHLINISRACVDTQYPEISPAKHSSPDIALTVDTPATPMHAAQQNFAIAAPISHETYEILINSQLCSSQYVRTSSSRPPTQFPYWHQHLTERVQAIPKRLPRHTKPPNLHIKVSPPLPHRLPHLSARSQPVSNKYKPQDPHTTNIVAPRPPTHSRAENQPGAVPQLQPPTHHHSHNMVHGITANSTQRTISQHHSIEQHHHNRGEALQEAPAIQIFRSRHSSLMPARVAPYEPTSSTSIIKYPHLQTISPPNDDAKRCAIIQKPERSLRVQNPATGYTRTWWSHNGLTQNHSTPFDRSDDSTSPSTHKFTHPPPRPTTPRADPPLPTLLTTTSFSTPSITHDRSPPIPHTPLNTSGQPQLSTFAICLYRPAQYDYQYTHKVPSHQRFLPAISL